MSRSGIPLIAQPQDHWSRRQFIHTLAGAGAMLLLHPWRSWAVPQTDPRIAAIAARTIGVDTYWPVGAPGIRDEPADLAAQLRSSGLSAICSTFAVDDQELKTPGRAYERFLNGLDAMDRLLESNGIKRSLNLIDLINAHQHGRPTVVQSVDGGHFLEGKLERVAIAYRRGLRVLGLLHERDASVPLGDVCTSPPRFGGLTAFGAGVIRECNRLGILVDLANAGSATLQAALSISSSPVLISHTGLDTRPGNNPALAGRMRPRLISEAQARSIAGAGGLIGVWPHLADTPLEYAANIRAMADVAGIDHVAIGAGTPPLPPATATALNAAGQGSPRAGNAWQGLKEGFYYTIVDALLQTGFSEEEIGKIGGGNFCRIFGKATAGAAR